MPKAVPKEVLDMLRAVPLFEDCTDRELAAIASLGTELPMKAGTKLTEQGAPGSELMIVLDGQATCTIGGQTASQKVATFSRGDFFGEMSLLDNGPRSATVVADTDVDVMVLESREFKGLLTDSPAIAVKMLVTMARRLRRADELMRY